MRQLPAAFWLLCTLNVVDSFAYFATRLNLVLFATRELALELESATTLYGVWGTACGLAAFVAGPIIDRVGTRFALIGSASLALVGRFGFACASEPWHAAFALIACQSLAIALSMPALAVATRALLIDDAASRRLAFSLLYSAMNVGSLLAGVASDANRLAELRPFMFVPAALSFVQLALAASLPELESEQAPATTTTTTLGWRELLRDGVFYKLAVFALILLGSTSVYSHVDTTLVEYLERAEGESAHYGLVYAINPLLVVALAAPIGERTHAYDLYWLIVVGTTLTALAPLPLAVSASTPYASSVAFMVALSLGECVYSPRLPEYALALAPRGAEGTYTTLASLPRVLVKSLVGASSGALYEAYCDADASATRCASLWFVVMAGAAATPLLLLTLKRVLYSADVRQRTN